MDERGWSSYSEIIVQKLGLAAGSKRQVEAGRKARNNFTKCIFGGFGRLRRGGRLQVRSKMSEGEVQAENLALFTQLFPRFPREFPSLLWLKIGNKRVKKKGSTNKFAIIVCTLLDSIRTS